MNELSFPVALGVLAAGLVAGIWAAGVLRTWYLIPVTVAVVAVLAGLYLRSYSRRPHAAASAPAPVEEEPFVDPVEEADRIDSGREGPHAEPAPPETVAPVEPGPPILPTSPVGDDPK